MNHIQPHTRQIAHFSWIFIFYSALIHFVSIHGNRKIFIHQSEGWIRENESKRKIKRCHSDLHLHSISSHFSRIKYLIYIFPYEPTYLHSLRSFNWMKRRICRVEGENSLRDLWLWIVYMWIEYTSYALSRMTKSNITITFLDWIKFYEFK